jgi:predicted phage replisome organizer
LSDNKKYYYLKFKENYFEQDHVKVIESMNNGHTYSLIILKLYLKSLKWEGQLRINEAIPYMRDKVEILASVINHDADHVSKAITLAKDLGIVDILNTGEIFMSDIHNFIGRGSSEAERKKIYRDKLKSKQQAQIEDKRDINETLSQNRPPELELELELKIDIEKEKEKKEKLSKLKQDIEEIYQSYPTRDPIQKYSTGRCKNNRVQIKKLLMTYDKYEIIEIINNFLAERKKARLSIKTFTNFLKDFPEKEERENIDVSKLSDAEAIRLINEGKIG